jgi:hypothetical protein
MSANYESNYSGHVAVPSPSDSEADFDDWGPNATWAETIATLLVTAVALLFVTFLAVVMGLA